MTTAVTSPAGPGARTSDGGRELSRFPFRWWPGRLLTSAAVAVLLVLAGSFLVVNDLSARTGIRTAAQSLAAADQRLAGLRRELAAAEQRLAGARKWQVAVTRTFDATQSTLASTQAELAQAQAGIHSQGVDVGRLDACLSGVEQALNQIAVGQTSGGLATMKASSSACATLDGAG
jgi:septal ring factor EnvC (AmiA/AmiB activator)